MADERLIGKNYTTPDLLAKVTGRAKYAEDFRVDGMLFCKLLLSPMPHARVRRIDTSAALALPGVKAILTADDLPEAARGDTPALTNEALFEGEPILAVAASDELTAVQAIERIELDLELLPFVTDPLESLRPDGPNATTKGNVLAPASGPAKRDVEGAVSNQTELRTVKWTEHDFGAAAPGQLPMGEATEQWTVGDIEAGLKDAALVVDETFVVQATSHQTLETRSALAYWRNGKLYLHGSTQSTMRTHPLVASWVGVDPANVVFISEYTGGGFGSKGGGAVSMCIPALLAKKANAPVMMRVSREDEHYIGHARTNMAGRARVGFRADGRITALDLFIVQDNGARGERGDHRAAGQATSLLYQPMAMRWRAINVLTNTPTRLFQRSPGEMQGIAIVEQAITKGASKLGIDPVEMHKINAPAGKAPFGPARNGRRGYTTSAFVKEALDRGAERFNWKDRAARAGKKNGNKVRGVGVAVGTHTSGSTGHDGLLTIRPDGKLYVQTGVGNLGTHSLFDLARVSADVLAFPWEKVEIVWGDTSKHLPYSCMSRSMAAQVCGGSCLGIGHALTQRWVYDPHYGVPLAKRFHDNKPLTMLDIPATMHADAVGLPDPETPVGARGVGEPPVGAAYGAVMNAIASAVGVDAFRRAPVTPDVVLMTLEHGRRMHEPLQAHV